MQKTLFKIGSTKTRHDHESDMNHVKRVGKIPQDWSVRRIGNCIQKLNAGKSVGGETRPMRNEEKGILRVSAVSYGRFRPDEYKVIPEDREEEVSVSAKKGRLIVSRANTSELVGASVYVHDNYPNLFLSDKLWQIAVDEKVISPEWLNHWLWMPRLRFNVRAAATGSSASMKNISQKKFKSLRIPVPPIERTAGDSE